MPSYSRFFPRFQMLQLQITGRKKQYIFKIKADCFYHQRLDTSDNDLNEISLASEDLFVA